MPAVNRPQPARPLSPHLAVYRWQLPMIASITHRATGIILALFVPVYLYLLTGLTGSPEAFAQRLDWMHSIPGKLVLWLTGGAMIYHLVNGLRFILLDAGWFESREGMRTTALTSVGAGLLGAVALAAFLW